MQQGTDGAPSGARRAEIALAGLAGRTEVVRAALEDADALVRLAALRALARLRSLPSEQVELALSDPDWRVRRGVCELAAWTTSDAFATALEDERPEVVEAAAFACGERSIIRAGPRLALLAETHPDPLCRESAVAAIGVLGTPSLLPALLGATADAPAIRRRAVIALANYEGPAVRDALERALSDRDWQVRQAAEDVLGVNRPSES